MAIYILLLTQLPYIIAHLFQNFKPHLLDWMCKQSIFSEWLSKDKKPSTQHSREVSPYHGNCLATGATCTDLSKQSRSIPFLPDRSEPSASPSVYCVSSKSDDLEHSSCEDSGSSIWTPWIKLHLQYPPSHELIIWCRINAGWIIDMEESGIDIF